MKRSIFGLIILSGLIGSAVQAQSVIDYNYVESSYQWTSYDDSSRGDSNGLEANLSVGLIYNLAMELGFQYASSEDDYLYNYGLVAYLDKCENIHWLLRTGGLVETRDYMGEDNSEDGVYAGLGVRYLTDENIELDGNVTYTHFDGQPDWLYEGVALFELTDNLALKTGVQLNRDADTQLTGGLRLNF